MICTEDKKTLIYEEYRDKVFGYIISKINNQTLAEDICADVFVKVYENIEGFDETKSSLSTWIYTITRNTLTDYYRTRRVNSEIPEDLSETGDIEDSVCQAETLSTLASALSKLSEQERHVIVFHYYSGMTFKAISEKMGLSYSYIKYLHNKALKALKDFL